MNIEKEEIPEWRENVEYRKENKSWLKKSAKIAIKLNRHLRKKDIKVETLATLLNVSLERITEILKGRENLTLETISKLEFALDIKLIKIK
jgi:antitoxin component HigA of HigAB toxin-antitoxin module